jgi:hypothetical protein
MYTLDLKLQVCNAMEWDIGNQVGVLGRLDYEVMGSHLNDMGRGKTRESIYFS